MPHNFDLLIEKTVSYSKEYGALSFLLKIGHSVNKCLGILKGESLRTGDRQLDKKSFWLHSPCGLRME